MLISLCFFFKDTATTEIYTLSLHDALPICSLISSMKKRRKGRCMPWNCCGKWAARRDLDKGYQVRKGRLCCALLGGKRWIGSGVGAAHGSRFCRACRQSEPGHHPSPGEARERRRPGTQSVLGVGLRREDIFRTQCGLGAGRL